MNEKITGNKPSNRVYGTNDYVCGASSAHQCLANCATLCEGIADTGMSRLNYSKSSQRFCEQTVNARRIIFRTGEPIESIPVICAGWAAIIANVDSKRRQIISFLLPGDLVSATLMIDDKLDFTVEAITEVTYRIFDRAEFLEPLTNKPVHFEALLKYWNIEFLKNCQLAVSLGQFSAEERIARLIIQLSDRLSSKNLAHDGIFYFPLRQQHIAEYTGLTPVHVSNVLSQLRRNGLIKIEDRSISILDQPALRRLFID